MNDFIKKIKQKNKAFKLYKNNSMGDNFSNLQNLSKELSKLTTKRKEDYNHYLVNKFNNSQSSPNTFWKILKTFCNGNMIPLIPQIIVINKLVSYYEEKANHLINSLLLDAHPLTMILKFLTQLFSAQRRGFLLLLVKTMIHLKLLEILTLAKAHVSDDISVKRVKLCDDSLVKPLLIIFQNCINSGVLPDSWKKSNIVPIHNKNDK